MSHAIISKNEASRITNIEALKLAAKEMGLDFRVCEPRRGHYRTYKDDNGGNWVGDWDLPEGVSGKQMGDNADFVISIPLKDDPSGKCYELGIVWDEKDQCWYPAYDFWNRGGGLEKHIGKVKLQGKKVISACPKMMEYYRLMEVGIKQRALGKNVVFQNNKQEQKLVLCIQ